MTKIIGEMYYANLSLATSTALALLLFMSTRLLPQVTTTDSLVKFSQPADLEVVDDEYVVVPQTGRRTSQAYRFSSTEIFTVQVNVDAFGENILGDAANEPSLAIDPTSPNRMVIGWRQFDTIDSNFRQAGYGFSEDGGNTWTFPGVIEPGIFRSDPVLDSDAEGNFYYNSLTSVGTDLFCHVFKSIDGGKNWDAGIFAQGGDKQWMVIDKTGGLGDGNIYAFWKQSFSICAPGFFTRSTNNGASFENCGIIPEERMIRGTLAVGPEGELYACGEVENENSFAVARSPSAHDSSRAVSWDFSTRVDLDGTLGDRAGPNPGGILAQAWIAVDQSQSSLRGNVYMLCSVKRFSTPDPLDVMFARSTDRGATWSVAVRINDDATNDAWQWFGTMSVAPNGRIDVAWLDTRDDPGGLASSLYFSHSLDGGVTWSKNERLSEAFDPHVGWPRQNKIGDYFHMISDDTYAHLAWAGTFNGEQDVYYSRISLPTVRVHEPAQESDLVRGVSLTQSYPNPFNPATVIRYYVANAGRVQLKIVNVLGEEVRELVDDERAAGDYAVSWDGRNDHGRLLSSGTYFAVLTIDGEELISKPMLLLK